MTNEEWEKQFKEDFKRKDWSTNDWRESSNDLDRLVWFISSLSPHNLWKAKEAVRGYHQSHLDRVIEKLKLETVRINALIKKLDYDVDHGIKAGLDKAITLLQQEKRR